MTFIGLRPDPTVDGPQLPTTKTLDSTSLSLNVNVTLSHSTAMVGYVMCCVLWNYIIYSLHCVGFCKTSRSYILRGSVKHLQKNLKYCLF